MILQNNDVIFLNIPQVRPASLWPVLRDSEELWLARYISGLPVVHSVSQTGNLCQQLLRLMHVETGLPTVHGVTQGKDKDKTMKSHFHLN